MKRMDNLSSSDLLRVALYINKMIYKQNIKDIKEIIKDLRREIAQEAKNKS